MSLPETEIVDRLARIETKLDQKNASDAATDARLAKVESRTDKLERIAYVALGVALASGLPQAAALIR